MLERFPHEDLIGLSFDNVSFMRGHYLLFQNLSFQLIPSQVLWIQGKNGTGKTSILKLASGLVKPSSGSVKISGSSKTNKPIFAYQSHKDTISRSLSVLEAITFWSRIYDNAPHINDIIAFVGLEPFRHIDVEKLSAGQKRRFTLARLILSNAPIWLLDEPKASMDRQGQALVETLLQQHSERGGSAIVTSHDEVRIIGHNCRTLKLEFAS